MALVRLLGFCLAVTIAGALGAHAQWAQGQKDEFANACVGVCQKNPKITPSQRRDCSAFCQCAVDANQKDYADYQAVNDEVAKDPQSPFLKRFNDNNAMCNKRYFGG